MAKIIDDNHIFDAVVHIFVTHGYKGTTTRAIAAAANINEATLFRKYGNKLNLVTQAIACKLSNVPLSNLVDTGDLEADLVAIVQAYLDTSSITGNLMPTLLSEAPYHPELQSVFNAPMQHAMGIVQITQQYKDQGLLKEEDPLKTIGSLIGPIMIRELFHRANPGLIAALPVMDVGEHVADFLDGRRAGNE